KFPFFFFNLGKTILKIRKKKNKIWFFFIRPLLKKTLFPAPGVGPPKKLNPAVFSFFLFLSRGVSFPPKI
ncbi:hypothetical protein CGSHiHH_06917, partial [Haemophilus influenzae PittHH]